MQRILNLVESIIRESEICNEDIAQETYLWALQNQSILNTYNDENIKIKIRSYVSACYNVEEPEFEQFEDEYPSYDFADEIDKYCISESIRAACRKLSQNKQFIIYYSFGFGKEKPLTPYEISVKFKLPMTAVADCKKEALDDLRTMLKGTF